jgi:gas vesicle protein
MGTLIGAAVAAIAGLAIATATVVGIVQTVKENPQQPATDTPVVQYGQR